jgi:deoxycytidine triphosphate deaminase
MILAHDELLSLLSNGVVTNGRPEAVGGSSIDVHLGRRFLVESPDRLVSGEARVWSRPRYLRQGDQLKFEEIIVSGTSCLVLEPGQFILAQTEEVFHLPLDMSAQYKMGSTMARMGLEHLGADWCNPGWTDSVLTLEIKNLAQYHRLALSPGDKIGSMVFFRHALVPETARYSGRYNNDASAAPSAAPK